MEYQRINNTDIDISRVGFGCWAIGGHGYGSVDDQTSIDAIHAALDIGVNFFDTAGTYGFGRSEIVLGKALGKKSRDLVVTTKFGVGWNAEGKTYKDCSPPHIIHSLENSLKRLGLETIPLYQMHWYDGVTPLEEIITTLEKCYRDGKLRYVGFCNMLINQLGDYHPAFVSSQLQYGLTDRQHMQELSTLSEHNKSVLAYGVLSRGLLSGKYESNANMQFGEADTRMKDPNFTEKIHSNLHIVEKLKNLAEKYGKTPAQVAIRWALDSPGVSCALVGIKTEAQALENATATEWIMDQADWEWLSHEEMNL